MKLMIPMVVTTQFTITMELVREDYSTIGKFATNMQNLEKDVRDILITHPIDEIQIITANKNYVERYTKKLKGLSKYTSYPFNINIVEVNKPKKGVTIIKKD